MRRSGYNCGFGVLAALLMLVLASNSLAISQVHFNKPQPGNVYKEFSRIMDPGSADWRVTDPNIDLNQWPAAAPFLPNPVLPIAIDDLTDAVRAEAVITLWGGHNGTIGKQVRFNGNGNPWINLGPLDASNGIPSGHPGDFYMSQFNVTIDVPLSQLFVGTNYFEGTNAGQAPEKSFGWGQHGWYVMMIRVYYDPATKSHPTGTITSPSSGGSFGDDPTVTANVSGGAGVNRVDFLAYYNGYDTDGDGVFQEYHEDYHIGPSDGEAMIHNHVGTAFSAPWQATWNTHWVPDQATGSVKLIARIRDNNGVWFVTDEVQNLSLVRADVSVRLYEPENVPESYWVKEFIESNQNNFTIPGGDDLSKGTDAAFFIRSWNGINGAAEAPNDAYSIKVDNWTAPSFGQNHYYSYNIMTFSPSELHNGQNTVSAYCNSVHHGVEILWPGPAVMVRYTGGPVPIQLASFAVTTVSGNKVELQWKTVSETNNYGFDVQKSLNGIGSFQTIPGSFVAGHGTTLQPQHYSYVDETGADANTYYRLKQSDLDGSVHLTEAVRVGESAAKIPTTYALDQNHPNPFNPSTIIRFALPADEFVTLKVYNVLGQVVRTLVEEPKTAGYYEVKFDGSGLTSGVYFYRLESGKFVGTKKLLLVK